MDVKNSQYLTIDKTNQMKGLLILLIIYGHIKGLTSFEQQNLLYVFHVTSFLILPFLFNNDKLSFSNITKVIKRYLIPFTIFFILTAILYSLVFTKRFELTSIIYAYFIATSNQLRETNGMSAYWFFPALIILLLTIMAYNSLHKKYKKYFLILIFFSHLFIGAFTLPNTTILQKAPMSFYITLYISILGFLIKYIIYKVHITTNKFLVICFIFLISSFLFYGFRFNLASPWFPDIINNPYQFILVDIIIVSGFLSILFLSQKMVFLNKIGYYSLGIYLIHPLIIQLINILVSSHNIFTLYLELLIVIFLSYFCTKLIYKTNFNKYIFPR